MSGNKPHLVLHVASVYPNKLVWRVLPKKRILNYSAAWLTRSDLAIRIGLRASIAISGDWSR